MFTGKDWVNSRFPESLYLPITNDYYDRVALGIDIMRQKDIVICGICKNIADNVDNILAKIFRLGSMFRSYSLYIYENDSVDATLSKLVQSSAKLNMPITIETETLEVEPHDQDKSEYRRERMAYARNKYLDHIRDKEFDNLIVCDLDIEVGWSYEGIAHSFAFDFDVVGSNGLIYQKNREGETYRCFYDTWAYRTLDDKEICGVEGNLLKYNRGQHLEQVGSCFGGLCIYKRDCITDSVKYTKDDCDHVTLHRQLIDNGNKIYLNPSQIVVYSIE